MPASLVGVESFLAVDIGSVNTRASLFDVVEGQYHYIATGISPSTLGAPVRDIRVCFQQAIARLQQICGRTLLNENETLILPCNQEDGSGVDRLVVTFTGGPQIRIVAAGLLEEVSLASARRLAESVGAQLADTLGFSDTRSVQEQVDAILTIKPDLVLLVGGTERGASRSVLRHVEVLSYVCQILGEDKKPEVLFAGNSALGKRIKDILGKWTRVELAPNVRPAIDQENLSPAQDVLSQAICRIRAEQVDGFQGLMAGSSASLQPTSLAFGRMIRFLSHLYDPARGVMGVDVGSDSTIAAVGMAGKLILKVHPLGLGSNAPRILEQSGLKDVLRWLPMDIPADVVEDYIHQKGLFPTSLPDSEECAAIEMSLARLALRLVTSHMLKNNPELAPVFEPYIASGSVLTRFQKPGNSLLMLLDGLQPVGVTTFVLDRNHLLPALGSIAKLNSFVPVQVLESGAFLSLGTVLCPVSNARPGTKILRIRMEYDEGGETIYEITQGTLSLLPLSMGQTARLHLETMHQTDLDPYGKHRTKSFKVMGGICGVAVDARGRPIRLPEDASRRRDLLQKWASSLE